MNNLENKNEIKKELNEQTVTLINRQNLSINGVIKIISLKPDLIQLDTNFGGIIISGEKLELLKLDNSSTKAEIIGEINSIKYIEQKSKEPFYRKLFK